MISSFVPLTNTLLAPSDSFTVEISAIDEGATVRHLKVDVNAALVFEYSDGILYADPAYTIVVTALATSLSVKFTLVALPVYGTLAGVDISYADSLTPIVYDASNYAYGAVTLRAQYPAPEQGGVGPNPPLTLVVEPAAPFTFTDASFLVDGTEAIQVGAPARPGFSGRAEITPSLIVVDVFSRRHFNRNSRILLQASLAVTQDAGVTIYYAPVAWSFHTNLPVTPLRNPGLARTTVDRPHVSAAFEMFRRGLAGSLRATSSSAAFSVLLYYAVKNSGLASMRATLPSARDLEQEKLLPSDQVSAVFVYDRLASLEPFWKPLLDELVRSGAVQPERATLLDRAWVSRNATDAVGAASAAILYGQAAIL